MERELTKLTNTVAAETVWLAVEFWPNFKKHLNEGSTGGYLYISDADNNMLAHACVGTPNPSKIRKYSTFSQEKATRLHGLPKDKLSWQSRNPEQDKWGGAIRLPENTGFFSFAGCTESENMDVSIALAYKATLLSSPYAEDLVKISDTKSLVNEIVSTFC